MRRRIMFYVQHLLGIGHVKRAAVIARSMKASGFDVHMVLGGEPVALVSFDGMEVSQLPPVRSADASFSALVDEHGEPVDGEWRDSRRRQLQNIYEEVQPDILLVEMFPFGRRQFCFELLPLLEQARGRSLIACSVRDVLIAKDDQAKNQWMIDAARQHFDHVLVHGDPRLLKLEDSFPLAGQINDLISYTGYVVDRPPVTERTGAPGHSEIVVSTGGGAVGETLLRCALEAARHGDMANYDWRLLAGENLPGAIFEDLREKAPQNVIVERARPDFAALLSGAALSISQGGYNTVMDILVARCPNLIIPFAAGSESEQSQRALAFAQKGLVRVLAESDVTVQELVHCARQAIAHGRPSPGAIDLDGAMATARLLAIFLDDRGKNGR